MIDFGFLQLHVNEQNLSVFIFYLPLHYLEPKLMGLCAWLLLVLAYQFDLFAALRHCCQESV